MALLSVAEATKRILEGAAMLGTETVALADAAGRVLAADLAALRSQPPFAVSAMDGYAVRAADVASPRSRLEVVGEIAAGGAFEGAIGPGQAVRIFTGAPVPDGADAILIQEDAEREGGTVIAREAMTSRRHIRPAGLDFAEGQTLLRAGAMLDFRALALAAAMNHCEIAVARRPRIAILATGDELVRPGEAAPAGRIVASSTHGIAALVAMAGGEAIDLGIVPDREDAIVGAVDAGRAAGMDVLVTLGGASVGDHDIVRPTLAGLGMAMDFWKIAMRPGKPLMAGRIGGVRVLGLPGNPVSGMVCALLFLGPLVRRLQGAEAVAPVELAARAGADIGANGERQDYMRAELAQRDGEWIATPFSIQDSSQMSLFQKAGALIVRPPGAAPAAAGTPCRIIRLDSPYV